MSAPRSERDIVLHALQRWRRRTLALLEEAADSKTCDLLLDILQDLDRCKAELTPRAPERRGEALQ